MNIPPRVEVEVMSLFESCLSSPEGAILYKCSPSRAHYIRRFAVAVRNASALASFFLPETDSPTWGYGSYWMIRVKEHPKGLVIFTVDKPLLNDRQILLFAHYANRAHTIDCGDPKSAELRCRNMKLTQNHMRVRGIDTGGAFVEIDRDFPHLVRVGSNRITKHTVEELDPDTIATLDLQEPEADAEYDPDG